MQAVGFDANVITLQHTLNQILQERIAGFDVIEDHGANQLARCLSN